MDAEFWEYLKDLIASSSIVIERPQGQAIQIILVLFILSIMDI
jgi:hypothetical protein